MIRAIKVRPNDSRVFYQGTRRLGTWHLPCQPRIPLMSAKVHTFSRLPVNQRTLINIFGYIHGYAGHGIDVMRRRWTAAEQRFNCHHMPYAWGRSTSRFVNEYTAHRWM